MNRSALGTTRVQAQLLAKGIRGGDAALMARARVAGIDDARQQGTDSLKDRIWC
jgi:hypothetical protein